jgi:cellulose synthase/poly-beta-1,6-N-acetylglucosamine synthase-like glycosyltransferase
VALNNTLLTTFGIVILVSSAVYFIGLLSFVPGVLRGIRRNTKLTNISPSISIIVCARNEEEHIEECLASIAALDYPPEKLEIFFVDDRSTDRTPEILSAWQKKMPNLRVHLTTEETNGRNGKLNALTQGLDLVTGAIILMTDADCILPSGWAKEHVSWYDDDTGMVSSLTSIQGRNMFDNAHSLEMVQVLAMSMAAINYKIPVSVIGNNLSIRKQTYDELGGYRNIPFSVTEDVALFQAVWHSKKWKVKFKSNPDLGVITHPPHDLTTWWRQKHRWVIGGKDIGPPGWIIIILGFIGAFTMVLAPFILPLNFLLIVLGLKFAADLFILIPSLRSLRRLSLLPYFPLFQIYLFSFLMCVPILYFQKDVLWKGRIFHT